MLAPGIFSFKEHEIFRRFENYRFSHGTSVGSIYGIYTFLVCLKILCLPHIFVALNSGGGSKLNMCCMGIIFKDSTGKSSNYFEI
jgi:hypothetical protein